MSRKILRRSIQKSGEPEHEKDESHLDHRRVGDAEHLKNVLPAMKLQLLANPRLGRRAILAVVCSVGERKSDRGGFPIPSGLLVFH